MSKFEKCRGLAIAAGLLYIVYDIISSINSLVCIYFFDYLTPEDKTLDVVIIITLKIIPLIVLGIILLMRKMNFLLLIPLILINVFYIIYFIRMIKIESYFWRLIFYPLRMLPWLLMFIVFLIVIIKNKNDKKVTNAFISFLGFFPGISLGITYVINRFMYFSIETCALDYFYIYVQECSDSGYDLGEVIRGPGDIAYIAENMVLLVAFILTGCWIYINTFSEKVVSTYKQYGHNPQTGMGQSFYQQNPPYYLQQQQYNQQPVNYQQGMTQPYGQPQYNQQYYQQPQYNQPGYQQPAEPQPAFGPTYEADMLKSYKELLDSGIIT